MNYEKSQREKISLELLNIHSSKIKLMDICDKCGKQYKSNGYRTCNDCDESLLDAFK